MVFVYACPALTLLHICTSKCKKNPSSFLIVLAQFHLEEEFVKSFRPDYLKVFLAALHDFECIFLDEAAQMFK